ncbi:hypothetical protein EDF46_0956 [Frondihabitans sp. PhB188]|uniref:TolB family protein n=1 Tax=Frondihabitans sp. PhB188 TaxID=2485200 RepID=UPI000FB3487E|nr:biopolymer transporter Tol [Frondihabitans sp. PhB188]ROQ41575.1 hypothetical protein EDF46_0956 [Frondihabitans sp. PhB188]
MTDDDTGVGHDAVIGDIDPAALEPRRLLPGQRCEIRVFDVAAGTSRLVHESADTLYEAPNWTRDGRLIVNAEGGLYELLPDGSSVPAPIEITGVPGLNNDHVLSPVDDSVFVSANDFHIYQAPLAGGPARRVTLDTDALHFLHGVSPDGQTLAYVRVSLDGWGDVRVHEVGLDGSGDRAVTTDPGPADGSEYSPDGEWIYLNTEQFSRGQAQIARIRPDGRELTQLTFDERVNWFPHVAPVGEDAVYISFPGGTEGHPADKEVRLVLVTDGDWAAGRVVETFNGGQGTINVNSWAPDGSAFAYVTYPRA